MTPEAADWVFTVVLTDTYRRGHTIEGTPALLRSCACQWGPCGWCVLARPEKCAHRLGTAPRSPQVEDWLGGEPVRRVGRPCVWHCPGPAVEADGQLELFSMGGAS